MQAAGQDDLGALGDAAGHHHRLGRAGGSVIHGGVGHIHAGQGCDLGLELEQIL